MENKERVIIKSIELFKKLGIRYVTMDQIAGELGMSKRTLYELFKDKDDLLVQCLQAMGKKHREEIHAIISRSENTIEALFKIAEHGEKKKSLVNVLFFEDLEKIYPHMLEKLKKEIDGDEPIMAKILKRGVKEGIFKKELKTEVVELFILEMMKICGNKKLFNNDINDRIIAENIIIPYFLGISTGKGQQLIDKHFKNSH